ncbi:MAG TPA: glycosyltransferase [Terracidiphilus sp.]|nr:glycosyltransferase [Terracidiphilus sp.]
MTHSISLVVATKDRPEDLSNLLASLRLQSAPPAQIVIVDASSDPVEYVASSFPELSIQYLRHWPPSAAAQRNAGIQACIPSSTLIGFADDDTTFEPHSFERMLNFWNQAELDILGAAFNIRNYPERGHSVFKRSALAEWLGLYSPKPGSVSPSGWQTVTGELAQTQFVDWLPSTATIFRREVFNQNLFDDVFDSYSYLEDLDFSYSISRQGRLAVVADAGFCHFPSIGGRVSSRQFGRFEVRNRLYFVRKHNLSVARCYLGLAIRISMSLASGVLRRNAEMLDRVAGNLDALVRATPVAKEY